MWSASIKLIATWCVLVAISLLYHHLQKPYCPAHNVVAKVLENNLFFQMPGLTTKQDDQEFCTAFNLKQTLTDNGSNSTVARIKEFAGKALRKLHFRVPDKIGTFFVLLRYTIFRIKLSAISILFETLLKIPSRG